MFEKIANMPWQLTKFIGGVVLIAAIIWIAIAAYANSCGDPYAEVKEPDTRYEVFIQNTGLLFYSDDTVEQGTTVTLSGYWQLEDGKFRYYRDTLSLDKKDFGPITVRRR